MAVMMKSAAGQKMAVRSASARLPLASRPALRPVRAQQARNDQPAPDAEVEIPATGDKIPLNRQKEPQSSLPPPVDNSQAKVLGGGAPSATFDQVMGFWGAPEIVNGRLAMLGFVAAMFAELNTGLPVTAQVAEAPGKVLLTFLVFIAASVIPFIVRRKPDVIGPFNPTAELINGRAAMLGFAALLFFEFTRHRALF